MHRDVYMRGMRDGIPVMLGYFVVSITIGIAARGANLTAAQATTMSLTNLTSAGQFASFAIIAAGAPYLELLISQAVINLRYCLMSCALSQKVDQQMPFYHRLIMAFGITDEIFGLAVGQKGKLDPWYMYGAMSVAIPGWTLGTLLGILSTGMLPPSILNAMNMALYGMFIAIFMPAARDNKILLPIIFISMGASAVFQMLPVFDFISSGMKIIILTLVISFAAAVLFPIGEESADSEGAAGTASVGEVAGSAGAGEAAGNAGAWETAGTASTGEAAETAGAGEAAETAGGGETVRTAADGKEASLS